MNSFDTTTLDNGIRLITRKNPNTPRIAINLFIGLCGILSLFSWFEVVGNAPIIGPTLLPNGNRTIKADRKANSTY